VKVLVRPADSDEYMRSDGVKWWSIATGGTGNKKERVKERR